MLCQNTLSIDVEDWFHILDTLAAPKIEQWGLLQSRVERNVQQILELLHSNNVRATFFWLGWVAKRHPRMVERCQQESHEIASHGYAHVLAYQVGRKVFREDIRLGKMILEDITSQPIKGFRTAGFGIKDDTAWAFDVIKEVGYEYDSSVFPSSRGHGGMPNSQLGPYIIETQTGPLVEVPLSAVEVFGSRLSFFGGGYLRLSPKWLIRWGIDRLHKAGDPLVVYVHPREIDPHHPRLSLTLIRRFKCYVNLKSTMPKLKWLCENYSFVPMRDLVTHFFKNK